MEALATASPQLAFEKLNLIGTAALMVTLFSATMLAGLLAYASLRVYHTGQWPPPRWRVIWETPIRTGRQASTMALFFLVLALAVFTSLRSSSANSLADTDEEQLGDTCVTSDV